MAVNGFADVLETATRLSSPPIELFALRRATYASTAAVRWAKVEVPKATNVILPTGLVVPDIVRPWEKPTDPN
ncbi:hypothetical protein [Streptomyces sp. NPDC054952]